MMPIKKFCAAPWVSGLLFLNGDTLPCCHNSNSWGNWKTGLQEAWNSEHAARFRANILEGIFPDAQCKNCYENGQAINLQHYIWRPLVEFCATIKAHDPRIYPLARLREIFSRDAIKAHDPRIYPLARLREILNDKELNRNNSKILADFFAKIKVLEKTSGLSDEVRRALQKLNILGSVVHDFLAGVVRPRHLAPHREVTVIATCNARCIHCPGKHLGSIEKGIPADAGKFIKEITEADLDQGLSFSKSIVDFYPHGSEFLFYRNWEMVARRLKDIGIKIRLSTNGMLLTEETIRRLIDNQYITKLNISLDGATKEIMESIRVNVKHEKIMSNMRSLFRVLDETKYPLNPSFTFCLMKRNYRDLPEFVKLVSQFRDKFKNIYTSILVQQLSMRGAASYREFVQDEHHSRIEKEELNKAFFQMYEESIKHKVPVFVFFKYKLEEFIKQGCPLPDPDFCLTGTRNSD